MKWWNVLSAIKTEFPVVTQLHSRFSVVCTRHTLYSIHIMYTNEGERGCTRKLWSMTSRNGRIIFYCYLYPLLWAMRYWEGIRFSACFVCVCSTGCIILFMGSRKHHFEELVYLPLFNSRQHFDFTECFNVGRWSVAAQAKENWTKGEKGNDRKLANKSHLSFCHSNWGVFRKMFL